MSYIRQAAPPSGRAMDELATCGDYLLTDIIGTGAFGRVFKGWHKNQGNFVAIKQLPLKDNKGRTQVETLKTEIDLLKTLNHPNIVKYIENIETNTHLNIILEYIESGSLASLISKYGRFPESLVTAYTTQILRGLEYLHEQGVIHRDIKGANILVGTDGSAKLADFGVAIHISTALTDDTFAGSPYWMAPEVVTRSGAVTSACDIWSLGSTLIELVTGSAPYFELSPPAALYHIVNDDHPPLPGLISENLEDFLHKCFQKDASKRATASHLLNHSWITEYESAKDVKDVARPTNVEKTITVYNDALREVEQSFQSSDYSDFEAADDATEQQMEYQRRIGSGVYSPPDNEPEEAKTHDEETKGNSANGEISHPEEPPDRLSRRNGSFSKLQRLSGTLQTLTGNGSKMIQHKYMQWLHSEVLQIITQIGKSTDQQVVLASCERLGDLLRLSGDKRQNIITNDGLVTLIGMLENAKDTKLVSALIAAINIMLMTDKELLTKFCMFGGLLTILRFGMENNQSEIRLEVANFIAQMCLHQATLQMLVGSSGLPLLTTFIDSGETSQALLQVALECIISIVKTGSSMKYPFCEVFAKLRLLQKIQNKFPFIKQCGKECITLTATIWLYFAQVKSCQVELGTTALDNIATVLQDINLGQTAIKFLKIINHLIGESELSRFFDNAHFAELIVQLITRATKKTSHGAKKTLLTIACLALQILVHLCNLNKKTEEQLVHTTTIRLLKRYAISGSKTNKYKEEKLKIRDLSIQLLCRFPHTSEACRALLWDEGLYELYLTLLDDPSFCVSALYATTAWLPFTTEAVQKVFVTETFVNKLAEIFPQASHQPDFTQFLAKLLKIASDNTTINKQLAFHTDIIAKILQAMPDANASDRLYCLKLLISLCRNCVYPKVLVDKYKLNDAIQKYDNDHSTLVKNLAIKLLDWITLVQFTPDIGFGSSSPFG